MQFQSLIRHYDVTRKTPLKLLTFFKKKKENCGQVHWHITSIAHSKNCYSDLESEKMLIMEKVTCSSILY